MPDDPTSPRTDGDPALADPAAAKELREYLVAQLRAATSAAVRTGADPADVTADLGERLRRVRQMLTEIETENPDPTSGG